MTLPASEETVVPALSAGLIAELKLEAEGRLPRGTVPILASQLLSLIEMVNSAREKAIRECAEIAHSAFFTKYGRRMAQFARDNILAIIDRSSTS